MTEQDIATQRAALPKAGELTDVDLLYPSRYLRAADLRGRDATVTITEVELDVLQMRGGETKVRPVLTLRGTDKLFVCVRTNGELIAAALGTRNPREWLGKRITLYPTRVALGREMRDAIRVRDRAPAPPTTATAASTARAPSQRRGREPGEDEGL